MTYETGTGKYEKLLERCASLEAVPTAVVHPCEISALEGAVEAAAKGLIQPWYVGPAEKIKELAKSGVKDVKVYIVPMQEDADVARNTLKRDPSSGEDDALARIYQLLRPGEPPRSESAREVLSRLFFSPKRYDLAKVGRFKLNKKLNHVELMGGADRMRRLTLAAPSDDLTTLSPEDFVAIIQYLLMLRVNHPDVTTDDIDHLGNRRVRSVGELLANQFNIGLTRMARIIRERMSLQDSENITPYDLVNARTISAVIQSFFGSSQLSQFMDQTNPLAELTHKRRLSALGPGGLTRDRAGFEVRDVHYTHYGRMCPIETPEGPNIGLISSLATYARVNDFGFLETPYRRVKNGTASRTEVEFISADVAFIQHRVIHPAFSQKIAAGKACIFKLQIQGMIRRNPVK